MIGTSADSTLVQCQLDTWVGIKRLLFSLMFFVCSLVKEELIYYQ